MFFIWIPSIYSYIDRFFFFLADIDINLCCTQAHCFHWETEISTHADFAVSLPGVFPPRKIGMNQAECAAFCCTPAASSTVHAAAHLPAPGSCLTTATALWHQSQILMVPTVKSPCVPLWVIMLEIPEGVVVPPREIAAPCGCCHSVPRVVRLLAARHDDWESCCHRFVPHICYMVEKNNSPVSFCSWHVTTFPLPILKTPSFIIPKTLGGFFFLHDCKVYDCIWTFSSTFLCSWREKQTFLEEKIVLPKSWCLEWVRWTMLTRAFLSTDYKHV